MSKATLFPNYALWHASLYEDIWNIVGATATILPFGDPYHGAATATTFTSQRATATGLNATCTWANSLTLATFGTPAPQHVGIIPVAAFNGTNEYATTPDDTYWSRGDGATDSSVSIVVWVNITDTANFRRIFEKGTGAASTSEWSLGITTTDLLQFALFDASLGVVPFRNSNAAVAAGSWVQLAAIYDVTGGSGATAANGITLYVNGAAVASTATNEATYIAMENTAQTVALGSDNGGGSYFSGSIAGGPLGTLYVQAVLTAAQIARLYQVGRRALALAA